MYIILAAALIAIAAYYPIKLIKFYCMESTEQSAKNQIIRDLRAGRINPSLVKLILGVGGNRLLRRELDHIFEWMLMNTNEWRVAVTSKDELVVVFCTSPFHPENWDDVETYKNVMRQMFGEHGTKDFRVYRASMAEANKIWKDLKKTEEAVQVAVYEYVRTMFGDEKVLAMILDINDNNETLVAILSGTWKGQKYWASCTKAMEVIPNDVAISELARLKAEWKEEKRKQSQEAARIENQRAYGNIGPGTYLIASLSPTKALYIVESVDMEDKTATCVRLEDLGVNYPANEKCVLPLANGFRVATPEEVAQILINEYCNE